MKTRRRHLSTFGFTLFCLLAAVFLLPGCGEGGEKNGASRAGGSSPAGSRVTRESPEEQFRRVRKSELGPNMKIGRVVMNVKRVNGNEVIYGGFYTLMFDERLNIIGDKPETFFFHAFYRDGKLVGWTPDR